MLDSAFRTALEIELNRRGCPRAETRRLLREITDHSADLRSEGSALGVDPQELEAWVDRRLGQPAEIAAQTIQSVRLRSWWSRHPVLAFCVLPILSYAGLAILLILASFFALDRDSTRSWIYAHPAAATGLFQGSLFILATPLVVALTCLALRCVHGRRWAIALAASSVLSLPMIRFQFLPESLILGLGVWNWITVPALSLVCAAAAYWELKYRQRQFVALK